MRIRAILPLLFLSSPVTAAPPDFDKDVVPVLAARCLDCHSGADPKGGFDLARKDAVTGAKGAVVAGKPEASELWRRISHAADDERMPPPESGKSLSGPQRELLRRWIAEGAVWREHWSFGPLTRPEVPPRKDEHDTTGAIDRFRRNKLIDRKHTELGAELAIEGEGAMPDRRRRRVHGKVHAFHERVGDHDEFARSGRHHHRAIVADADAHVGALRA